MRAKASNGLFVWNHLLRDGAETVVVMPSPHAPYKSGISSNDARATAEIYAYLSRFGQVELRTPDLLGDNIGQNLIVIGGKKANPVAEDFQKLKQTSLIFDLEDGVIYDKEKQFVLTPEYANGQQRTVANLVTDYGLITYTDNPSGKLTKILHLAGIRGCGTLAAATATVDPSSVHQIEKSLSRLLSNHDAPDLENRTIEILVKVSPMNGRLRRDGVQIEKISVRNEKSSLTWESDAYSQLRPAVPHRVYISCARTANRPINVRVRIDNQESKFEKSADRLNVIYFLAKRAREDYLNKSENRGWVSGLDLAQRLWQITHRNGAVEISEEIKREVSDAIKRWATHLQKRGKLTLSDNIELDCQYINSEILIFDSDIKKKIVDLVHIINHGQKSKDYSGLQLIECKPGLGYRINIHPALIFINECSESSSH